MNKNQTKKGKRVVGENYLYFFFHNILSTFFFFIFCAAFGIFSRQDSDLGSIFSLAYLELFFMVFVLAIFVSFLSRIMIYVFLINCYELTNKRSKSVRVYKSWGQINTGINRLGGKYFFSVFLTVFLFLFGLQNIIESSLFTELGMGTFLISYLLLKIIVLLTVYYAFNK